MTETEAKNKWCPMVRYGVYGEGYARSSTVTVNRDPRHENEARCIGSACMMWRGEPVYKSAGQAGPVLCGASTEHGFCGLAGKP